MATYKKDINLLSVMRRKRPRINPFAIIIPILVFVALGTAVVMGVLWFGNRITSLTLERDSLQSYIDSARLNDSQAETDRLRMQAEDMAFKANEVKSVLYGLSSYPDLSGEDFQVIFDYAGTTIELSGFTYDRRTATLSFSATATSVHAMPVYVQSLRECGIFSDVQYTGYVNSIRSVPGNTVTDEDGNETVVNIEISEYRYDLTCQVAKPQPFLPPIEEDGEDEGDDTEDGEDS
jgi:hypothetical protein